jgi:hypothetical protein
VAGDASIRQIGAGRVVYEKNEDYICVLFVWCEGVFFSLLAVLTTFG